MEIAFCLMTSLCFLSSCGLKMPPNLMCSYWGKNCKEEKPEVVAAPVTLLHQMPNALNLTAKLGCGEGP